MEHENKLGPEEMGPDEDLEIHEMLGHEMMDAIHAKDHKRILEGIEAMVLNCMNKHSKE